MPQPIAVLVVEDQPGDAEQIISALKDNSLDPTWHRVRSADELLSALASRSWDAILSAYSIPGFGAPQALDLVRKFDVNLPFIVVSSAIGEEIAVELLRAGANDYVLKNSLTRLAAAIHREVIEDTNRRALREAERAAFQLAAIVSSTDDAIYSETLDHRISSWNPGAERLFGWPSKAIIGRDVAELVPADQAEQLKHVLLQVQLTQQSEHVETVHLHQDGSQIHVSLTISPIRDKTDQVVGYSRIAHNMTDKVKADRERAKLFHELGERVKELQVLQKSATCLQNTESPLVEVLTEIVALLPPGFQYPEIAEARICFGEHQVQTPDFTPSAWQLKTEFTAAQQQGTIEVVYLAERPSEVEGPFLAEERRLLISLAEMLQSAIELRFSNESLATRERLFRAMVEKSYEAVVLLDATGTIVYACPACEPQGGSPLTAQLGQNIFDWVHPDDLEGLQQRWHKLLQQPGGSSHGEVRYRQASGSWGVSEITLTNLLDDPDITAVVANFHEVTERVAAQAERQRLYGKLQQTSQLLQVVADNTTDAIYVKDREGRYLFFNQAAAQFVGRSAEEVLGQNDLFIFAPESAKLIMEHDRLIMESGQTQTETEELSAAGVTRIYQATKTPYRDIHGNVMGMIGIARDVTAQMQAEKKLRDNEVRYRRLLDCVPDPMFVYDRETLKYLAVNDAAVFGYGYSREEFLQMTIKNIRPPEDIPNLLDMLGKSSGGFQNRGTWRHRKRDGTIFDVEITAHDIDLDERPACIIIARDITQRRQAEQALALSEERLRLALAATGLGTFDYDVQNNTLVWDSRAKAILGVGENQAVTTDLLFNLVHPEDLEHIKEKSLAALDPQGDGSISVEYRVIGPDGKHLWIASDGQVKFQKIAEKMLPVRLVGTVLDITERKHAQELLQDKEAKLVEAVRIARMGYWNRDVATDEVQWSDELYGIFGVAPAAFGNSFLAFWRLCIPWIARRLRPELPKQCKRATHSTMCIASW